MPRRSKKLAIAKLTDRDLSDALVRGGSLRHLLFERPASLAAYDAFHQWRETRDRSVGQNYAQFVTILPRRAGKTVLGSILGVEQAIRYPGSFGLVLAKTQVSCTKIVSRIYNELLRDKLPDGYAPVYYTRKGELSHVCEIPATGSVFQMVGLDTHSARLRGTGLDWALITEAGYHRDNIDEIYRGVVLQQFRDRPTDPFCFVESSYAESEYHPLHAKWKPDAIVRGAHFERDIYQIGLSEKDIEDAIRETGGVNDPLCQRELLNIHGRDVALAMTPSFNKTLHTLDEYQIPAHCKITMGLDPGYSDHAAAVWVAVDQHKAVVVASWSEPRLLTDDLASKIKATEKDLLSHTSWWSDDTMTLRPNPYRRMSDTAPSQLADLKSRHGLSLEAPRKGTNNASISMDAVDSMLRKGLLVIAPGNDLLLELLGSAKWKDAERKDPVRTDAGGHADLLMALAVCIKGLDLDSNPEPPLGYQTVGAPGYATTTYWKNRTKKRAVIR